MSFSFSRERTSDESLRASRSFSAASRLAVLSPSIASISRAMSRFNRATSFVGRRFSPLRSAAIGPAFAVSVALARAVRFRHPSFAAWRTSFCGVIPAFAAVSATGINRSS